MSGCGYWIVALATILMGLGGCAGTSQDDLRKEASHRYEFDVPGNYQANYKAIADAARRCLSTNFISHVVVEADLLPDIQKGTVDVGIDQFSTEYIIEAEIVPSSAGDTHVTVVNNYAAWSFVGPRMEAWAKGNPNCSKT